MKEENKMQWKNNTLLSIVSSGHRVLWKSIDTQHARVEIFSMRSCSKKSKDRRENRKNHYNIWDEFFMHTKFPCKLCIQLECYVSFDGVNIVPKVKSSRVCLSTWIVEFQCVSNSKSRHKPQKKKKKQTNWPHKFYSFFFRSVPLISISFAVDSAAAPHMIS